MMKTPPAYPDSRGGDWRKCRSNRIFVFLVLVPWASCQMPSVHLSATRWSAADSGLETQAASKDGEPRTNPDQRPSVDGRSPAGCETFNIDLSVPRANVLFLVERSHAMESPGKAECSGCTTWEAFLDEGLPLLFKSASRGFRWGLKFYPTDRNPTCHVSSAMDVPVEANQQFLLQSTLKVTQRYGAAPLRSALRAATNYLVKLQDLDPKFLLLFTYGAPTCNSAAEDQSDLLASILEIKYARSQGLNVWVWSMGPDSTQSTVMDLARTCGMTPEDAFSIESIAAEMELLAMEKNSCRYPLPIPDLEGRSFSVLLDDENLAPDSQKGWSYAHGELVIHGTLCKDFRSGYYNNLTVQVGCPPP